MSFRNRLVLSFVMMIILSLGIVTILTLTYFNRSALENYKVESELKTQIIDGYFTAFFRSALTSGQFIAQSSAAQSATGKFTRYMDITERTPIDASVYNSDEMAVYNVMMQAKALNPDFGEIFFGQVDGGHMNAPSTILPPKYDPRIRPWFKETQQGLAPHSITPIYLSNRGRPVVTIGTKVQNLQTHQLIGILGIHLELTTLQDYIMTFPEEDGAYIMIVDPAGTVVADSRGSDYYLKEINAEFMPELKPALAIKDGLLELTLDGTDSLAVIGTIDEVDWRIITIVSDAEIYAPTRNALHQILIAAAVLSIIAIAIAILCCCPPERSPPLRLANLGNIGNKS